MSSNILSVSETFSFLKSQVILSSCQHFKEFQPIHACESCAYKKVYKPS